jgi:hypothetical protein
MNFKRVMRTAAAFVLGTIFCVALNAQTGTISGTILDPSGSGVPEASVTIKNLGTAAVRTAATDVSGAYAIPNVLVGHYDITIEKQGFTSLRFPNVELTVAQNLTVNGSMALGAVSEQVEVAGSSVPTIDLESAQISNIVDQKRILNLPLLTRDPYSLVLLSPGTQQTTSSLGGFSVNGQRERNNNFLLDGVDNNDASVPGIPGGVAGINPDSTQEFRVITNNFLPEYGRNTGAIVDIVTRSGTNAFHGSGYEFNRVNAMAARDYFNPSPDQQDPFVRNDFGFSLGGPVKKDQTFFFVDSEWQRYRTTLTESTVVPTAAFKTGIFDYNGQSINLADPGSPNNVQGLTLDPAMQKVLSAYPNPNGPAVDDLRALYYFPSASRQNTNGTTFRLDHRFNDKYSVFGRYVYNGFSDPDPFHDEALPGIGATASYDQSHSIALNFIAAFRPNLINEFRAGLNRADATFACAHSQVDQYSTPDPFGFGTDYSFNTSIGVPTIANLGCSSLGDSNSQFRRAGTWHYVDNLSWVHGQHNIKVGGEFRYVFENGYDAFGSRPIVDFTPYGNFGVPVVTCANGCDDDEILQTMAAGLLGFVGIQGQSQFFDTQGQRTPTNFSRYVQHEYGAFFQDQWKLRPNLTLQLGLRYQFDGVPFERDGQISNLFANSAGPAPLTFSAVGPGTGQELYYNDPFNFEPRFGLAWDPFNSGKTSVRVGYGIFHDRIFGNLFTNLKTNPPFVGSFQNYLPPETVNTLPPPATLPAPSATVVDGDYNASTSILDQYLKTPYVQSWNIGIQRQLGNSMTVEVNYVGSGSHRLIRSVDGNPPQPSLVNYYLSQGYSPSDLSGGLLRYGPLAGLPQVTGNLALLEPVVMKSIGNATYNGLQTVFTKQMSNGIQFQAAYTWSHTIDDAPDPLAATFANRNIARNSFDLHEERGSSDYDLRHRLVLNYMLELPFGPGHARLNHGLAGRVLGGWELNGISTFQSGRPFDIFSSRDAEHTALSSRPDLVGDPSIPAGSPKTQTGPPASAFAPAPYGSPGSVGRNTFTGPTYYNTDVDLVKRFAITERINLQFRAEFYNIFNQVQFEQPGTSSSGNVIDDPGTFGQSLSELTRADGTTAARQIQLALKLVF